MVTESQSPDIGVHGLISTAFTELGHLRVITLLIQYPSIDKIPSPTNLRERIRQLSVIHPILGAKQKTGKDGKAYLEPSDEQPKVYRWEYEPDGLPEHDIISHTILDRAFNKALRDMKDLNNLRIQVDHIIPPETTDPFPSFIAISADHTLVDAAGLKTFAQHILNSKLDISSSLEKEPFYPHHVEDLMDFVPEGPLDMPVPDHWPMNCSNPMNVPGAFSHHDYPLSILERVKSQGKRHGIPTLNPVLELAFLTALTSVVPETENQVLNCYTMTDERPGLGSKAPKWSHNYFSVPSSKRTIFPLDKTDFWAAVKIQVETTKDEAYIRGGRYGAGFVKAMPSPVKDILAGKVISESPYFGTIFFSNLTRVDLPEGANDIRWTAAATPFLAPMIVNLIGSSAGLRVTIAFRDGAGLTANQADAIGVTFGQVLERLAEGETGTLATLGRQ
ncbi:hypothetical protein BD324DRAFT_624589 [Kockovaella imperatae]|uniref:Alcohol acetyltransferase n=1 Tax=Kockovaella imperatae TaxID=4999 RepID=A0A1Y1UG60_9TREE|nr:hypothetical protein BD324DRAFT_624589 [Kockovaella imperatae]ORX37051.1 hypothetical protein BD324DRAFT_624589 [Kockovaella imperatae]